MIRLRRYGDVLKVPVETQLEVELNKYIKMVNHRGHHDVGLEIIRAFKMGYHLGYSHRINEELKEMDGRY